ncbi:Ribosomal RNA-processing protein 14 [Neolecta irregularis DAH-3]|uniref:Ribosomal RNA-processing protein 14 n=1 Tax=Neolecta irregularis (strain DAH-3) TaxID=1198029 RepID=A0A1U7LIX7_NEOID|nr:Ribosomal RNA-processing protein 14 [Neolecta irregularis DAH-3]|eukprot:OLL22502.1 Ribosomal RNA-processing protein 14 [Neolecta irregularis DAH-3]
MEGENSLLERLKSHNNAFESLLALIPGKLYHHEESSTQWNKKKQTKDEAKRAKRAKLDPDSSRTAADIQNEKALRAQQQHKSEPEPEPTTTQKASKKPKIEGKKPKQKPKAKFPEETAQKFVSSDGQNGISSSDNFEDLTLEKESPETSPNVSPEKQTDDKISKQSCSTISELKAKLHSRIKELRANRKAPGSGVDGAPKNRDAILEARRKKKEARREKLMTTKTVKDRESEIKDEPEVTEPSQTSLNGGLAFSRVTFGNDEEFDVVSGGFKKLKKRKAIDVAGALKHAETKKLRLQGMDDVKRSHIEQSDSWHKALLQVRGEKVRDDEKLLKKAIKRQEKQKKKSEKEWSERIESVRHKKEQKQKKRETNIQARKDLKKTKGSKKKRPGFEGSIRAKKRK